MNEDGKKSILKIHLVHVLPIGYLAESWNLTTIRAKGKISFGISCYFAGIFLESLESFVITGIFPKSLELESY